MSSKRCQKNFFCTVNFMTTSFILLLILEILQYIVVRELCLMFLCNETVPIRIGRGHLIYA